MSITRMAKWMFSWNGIVLLIVLIFVSAAVASRIFVTPIADRMSTDTAHNSSKEARSIIFPN